MQLVTAHRILIGSAIAFFLFFGVQRFLAFRGNGDPTVLVTAGAGFLAALGLAAYYRSIGSRR